MTSTIPRTPFDRGFITLQKMQLYHYTLDRHHEKKWWTHKTLSWFINTKVYLLQHFLSNHQEERKKFMKYKSTVLARHKETCNEEREGRHRPWIIFHVFSCSSNTCFLVGCILLFVCLGSNCFLYIIMSHSQLNSFPISYPAYATLWDFHLNSFQPIKTHCWFAVDRFPSLTRHL